MGRTARRRWCPRGGRGASPPSPSTSPAQPSESCEPASESCCSPESLSSSDSPPLPAALPAALRDSAPALRGLFGAGAARGGGAALAAGAAARPRAATGASRCGWRPMCSKGGSSPAPAAPRAPRAPRAACGAAPPAAARAALAAAAARRRVAPVAADFSLAVARRVLDGLKGSGRISRGLDRPSMLSRSGQKHFLETGPGERVQTQDMGF